MHLVMRYLCFFGIVKRQGVKRRMDKRSTSEEQKSGYLGLTRADEERHLADVISVAQQNLEHAGADIRKVNEDLADLLETYDVKDKEGVHDGFSFPVNVMVKQVPSPSSVSMEMSPCDSSTSCLIRKSPVPRFSPLDETPRS